MALTHELISQFAKLVNQGKKTSAETTVYGTVVADGENKYVRVDGSDQLIPIEDGSTVAEANVDERVSVLIKDHTATVTGNVSSPAARTGDVKDVSDRVTEIEKFDLVLAERVEAQEGYIEDLQADMAEIGDLKAATAKIEQLEANDVKITGDLEASNAEITNLKTTKLDVEVADAKFATIEKLDADTAEINQLLANKASVTDLKAVEADITKLNAEKASVKDLEAVSAEINDLDATFATIENLDAASAKIEDLEAEDAKINGTLTAHNAVINNLNASYATIDFANINMAAVEELFAKSGIISDLKVGDASITGELVGVTIKGDLVEAGTLKADRLVVLGSDGKYYALNTDFAAMPGVTPVKEDAIHGSVLVKKSIVAEKIDVKDLVAFGATIGGFKITSDSIHSVVKASVDNTTEGVYMDSTGQFNVGNGSNFLKFFKDQNGEWKLNVSADTITFGTDKKSVEEAIDEVAESARVNSEDLTEYISATTKELESLQGQIDGSIMTWFYEYVPANDNIPAVEWDTTELKNNHLGDLFYDTITGYCYRWQVQNNSYFWTRITDVDVTKALSDAAKAQSTADGKRRVFVDTPKPPYEIGDLWTQGASGELMRCQTTKTESQSYAAADWVKASKYTDDTAANAAQADANALKTRVTNAETQISQNRDAIALRATKDEVTKTLGGYYTKTEADAKLEVSAEAVKTEVSKTYATKQEVDDIEIGGRNLLLNSSFKENLDEWQTTGIVFGEQNTVSGTRAVRVDDISAKAPATVQLASKNLLPYPYSNTTKEQNGITITDNGDGTVKVEGYPTGSSSFSLKSRLELPAGTYTFSLGLTENDVNTIVASVQLRNKENGNWVKNLVQIEGNSLYKTFTLTEEMVNVYYLDINLNTGYYVVEKNLTLYPQIEKGSTATSYTQYVGSKNLLDLSSIIGKTVTANGGTLSCGADGGITGSGVVTGYMGFDAFNLYLPKGKYILSASGTFSNISCTVVIRDANAASLKESGVVFSGGGFSFNTEDYPSYSYISVIIKRNNNVEMSGTAYFQIEKGSTATPYTPYSPTALLGHSVTVCGKNILSPLWEKDLPLERGGLTYSAKDNGGISITGELTATNEMFLIKEYFPAGTYTFSAEGKVPAYTSMTVRIRTSNTILRNCGSVDPNRRSVTFSITEEEAEVYQVWINLYSSYNPERHPDLTADTTLYPQIELGTKATEYEPYKEPIMYSADENGIVTIDTPYSPSMTVVADTAGVNLDMTYSVIAVFLEKNGKQCMNIKHDAFGETKCVYQNILTRIERGSKYMFSGWFLIENFVQGPTEHFRKLYVDGYYTNSDGVRTWYALDNFWLPEDTAGQWQYVTGEVDASALPENSLDCNLYIHTRDMTGDVYFRDLKLEKGTKATDWTPAPEDTENDIADVKNFVLAETRASLDITESSILSKVEKTYVNANSFDSYTEHASSQVEQTARNLTLSLESVTDGINEKLDEEIKTREKHFKFSEDGLVISAGSESVKVIVNNDIIAFIKGDEQRKEILTDGVSFSVDDTTTFKNGSGIYVVRSASSISMTPSGYICMWFEDGSVCVLFYENKDDMIAEPKPGTAFIYNKDGPSLVQIGEQLLGYWDGNNFYGGNLMIRVDERAQFGDFAAIPRSNGNLSWLKVR